jgi:hypothetical protein
MNPYMGLLNLLLSDPLTFVLVSVPLLYSIIIHELAHGWVAYRMGDPTAKWQGRLSLNPLKHLDPIGTLMLFLVGFGWAKPVPVNFENLHDPRRGLIFVSAAGIVANLFPCGNPFFDPLLPCADQHHACGIQPDPDPAPRRLEDPHGFWIREVSVFSSPPRALRFFYHHRPAVSRRPGPPDRIFPLVYFNADPLAAALSALPRKMAFAFFR